ncbi:MAG: class D sortase [Firmicutes bacterium]|nr:class D sortase [Bacillota bacterium]
MIRRILAYSLIGLGSLAAASPLVLRGLDHVQQTALSRKAPRPRVTAALGKHGSLPPLPLAAPLQSQPGVGAVVASLTIPNINVHTNVVQGTSDAQLLIAPGHLVNSVLPGEPGLSVIAAHNATYFRQIDRLKAGDLVQTVTSQGIFTFRVTTHEILGQNEGLPNSSAPTLALEACYPLDAMYFTPNRYVVFAELIRSQLTPESLADATAPPVWSYHADILPAISQRYPLWLSENNLPMGTLRYEGIDESALSTFVQGSTPLNLTADAIRLLEAYRYTSQSQQLSWLQTLLPTAVPAEDPFWGAQSVSFPAPIQLTVQFAAPRDPVGLTLWAPTVVIDGQRLALTFHYRIQSQRIMLVGVTAP